MSKLCDCCGSVLDLTDIDVYKYKMFERKSIVDDEPFHKVDKGGYIYLCERCSDELLCRFVRNYGKSKKQAGNEKKRSEKNE